MRVLGLAWCRVCEQEITVHQGDQPWLQPSCNIFFWGMCWHVGRICFFSSRLFATVRDSMKRQAAGPGRPSAGEDRRQRGLLTSTEGRRDPVATEGRGANSALDGDAEVTPPPAPPAATGGSA